MRRVLWVGFTVAMLCSCSAQPTVLAAGQSYAVVETAAGTGNRLLRFRSRSQALARSLFEAELRPALARSVEEQRCTREMGQHTDD